RCSPQARRRRRRPTRSRSSSIRSRPTSSRRAGARGPLQAQGGAQEGNVMFDHMGFAVRDLGKEKAFYEAALKPLGLSLVREGDGFAAFGSGRHSEFWIGTYGPPPGRIHFAFVAKDRAAVDAFYTAAMAAGGKDNGRPGIRES